MIKSENNPVSDIGVGLISQSQGLEGSMNWDITETEETHLSQKVTQVTTFGSTDRRASGCFDEPLQDQTDNQ